MSANKTGTTELPGQTLAEFKQNIPIPAYLMALVVGKIEWREIGPRSRVWAEPTMVDKAAMEFNQTEKMLQIAESICGPYLWGNYDILVLPPSFPFGGMENPTLTYITPTAIAGDGTGLNVIAHEIAHSWTGNLVTHFNFEHFWIKEAFTVFLERKIMGRIYGEPMRQFLAEGGWKDLKDSIEQYGEKNPLTKLHLDLTGLDPTDSFSKVPYEKGSTVIWYWDELYEDSELFDKFIRYFLSKWKFQSITLHNLFETILEFTRKEAPLDVYTKLLNMNTTAWFEEPGLPPYKPEFDSSLSEACVLLAEEWINYDSGNNSVCELTPDNLVPLIPLQKIEFLSLLLQGHPIQEKTISCMDTIYNFSDSGSFHIKFRWLKLGIRSRYKPIVEQVFRFTESQGRIYFNQQLFRDMYDWKEQRVETIETYHRIKNRWMFITRYLVGRELKLFC
ncbi:leukotriene A-4 hydrolase-like [Artemia franciscana]|uniref:leukotriene A-4 hydrolase-like n=1 Tax=Artemia franciscana TaxID=6661 RepID=UPI0032DB6760